MNLTNDDLQTILYSLEGYMQANDDTELVEELEGICYRIQRQIEVQGGNNSGKVYPQVDNVPEQVYQDWLYNKEANKIWLIQTITPRIEVARL